MFGLLESLAKATVAVVTTPVALAVDLAEEIGLKDDTGVNHTGKALNAVIDNLEDAVEPRKW